MKFLKWDACVHTLLMFDKSLSFIIQQRVSHVTHEKKSFLLFIKNKNSCEKIIGERKSVII